MSTDKKNRMERLGRGLSGWLSRKESGISKGRKKLLLFVITVLVGSYCLFLIAGNGSKLILGNGISLPKIAVSDSKDSMAKRIKQLGSYLDSLKNSPTGRHAYDSLLKEHPYIYDSIAQWKLKLEKLPGN